MISQPFYVSICASLLVLTAGCGKSAPPSGSAIFAASNTVPAVSELQQPSWTTFRGTDQAVAPANAKPPAVWSEKTNIVWKTEIQGIGASSPVLDGTNIYLTTALQNGRSLRALCVDAATGKLLFDQEILSLEATPPKHQVNSPASPTPVVSGDKLFVSFGAYGVACLSTSGQILWKNTELKWHDEEMGPGASPVLVDDLLILSCDGTDKRFIAALHKDTGKLSWKTDRSNEIAKAIPFRKAFSTPICAPLQGIDQIISSSSYRVFGYEPKSGKELWNVEIPGFCPIPVPLVRNNWIFVCTGYNRAELWALKMDQPGSTPQREWKISRSIPLISSPVLVGEYIYFVSQEGIASCVAAATGKSQWNERVGGNFWSSPVAADGRLYFCGENGTTTVLSAAPEFHVMAKNALDGEIMATPAIAGGAIFLRTKTHLYRVESQ